MQTFWSFLIGDKRIHFKAVIILAAGLIVLGTSTYFVHAFQVKRNARSLLEQAAKVEQEGETVKAIGYLRQYLGMIPKDTDALEKYGFLLNKQAKTSREIQNVYLTLHQVLRLDATRQATRRLVVQVATRIGRYGDGQEHLAVLLKENPAGDAEIWHWSGRCEAGLNQFDKAALHYEKAMAEAPQQIDIALEYANLLRGQLKLNDRADLVIDRLVSRDKRSPKIRLDAARYFARFGLPEQAWQHLRFALDELGSPSDDLLFLAGEVALTRGEIDQARKLFEQGRQLYPADERMNRGLAQIDIRQGEFTKALGLLQRSMQAMPTEPEELWNLANLLIDAGDQDKARGLVLHVRKTLPTLADFLEARLLMRSGRWGEASVRFARVRTDHRLPRNLAKRANLFLAECADHLLNPDQKLEALRRAVSLDPDWSFARRHLANTLVGMGKFDPALVDLRVLADQVPEAREDLARLLVERNRLLPPAQRDWAPCRKVLDQLPLAAKDSLSIGLLEVEILALQDKIPEARKRAEAERDRHPDQVLPWLILAGLAEKTESSVLAVLLEAQTKLGPRIDWVLARARLSLRGGIAKARTELPSLLKEFEQFKGKDRERLAIGLAQAFAAAGDLPAANTLWTEQLERDADSFAAWLGNFDYALDAKDEDAARKALGHLRRLEGGEGAHTVFGEAALRIILAKPGSPAVLAEARPFLVKAAALRPSWARVPLLEASAADREGQKVLALAKYKAALDLGESRLSVVRRTLELMYEQRQIGEANALLHRLPERALTTPELGKLATQVIVIHGSREGQDPTASRKEALDLARKAVAVDSKDHRDYLWLGNLAALGGEAKEAETALRKACDLKGDAPENWTALILFLARTDAKAAEAALEQARGRLPKENQASTFAIAEEALGRGAKAEEHYLAAVAARPDDPALLRSLAAFQLRIGQPAKAEATLRKMIQVKANPGDLAWARRSLALALAFQGGHPRYLEAEALLEQNRKAGDDLEDRKTKALILARQPAQRRAAIQMFESLGAPAGEARFLLAQLYEADGNWRVAESHYLALVTANDKNPIYLGRYVRGLLAQKNARSAQTWLDRLAALAPQALETIDLQVAVLKEMGGVDEAVKIVKKYAETKDARLEVAAFWFERLAKMDEAEKTLRQFTAAAKQPESVLLLAQFLGRHNKSDEALALCEKAWEKSNPEAVASASLKILNSGQAKPEQLKQLETRLTALVAKKSQAKGLNLLLAELLDLQGRLDAASKLHRQILAQDPKNIVSLNNLAYITALKFGDNSDALKLINQALDLAGPVDELLDTRALIYLKNLQADLALKDLQQAIAQAPSGYRYFHLAQANHLAGEKTAAADAWRRARELGFTASQLHTLERPAYDLLAAELK